MSLEQSPNPEKLWWVDLTDEELLQVRMCDLELHIEGTHLESRIACVQAELSARSLRFEPHYWLSDEWFCPDGIPGIAIPFYLAHPRLERLEKAQLLEVEGGEGAWCLKILRHEGGHPWLTIGARYDIVAKRLPRGWRITWFRWKEQWTEGNAGLWEIATARIRERAAG